MIGLDERFNGVRISCGEFDHEAHLGSILDLALVAVDRSNVLIELDAGSKVALDKFPGDSLRDVGIITGCKSNS